MRSSPFLGGRNGSLGCGRNAGRGAGSAVASARKAMEADLGIATVQSKCPRGAAGDKTTLKCLKRRFRPMHICVARIVLEHSHLVVAQRKIAAAHACAHRETRKKNEDCS